MILAFNIADIIRVPFGYLLDLLYQFTTSYGLALILFALIVKLILLPASAKSKKSMMKMSRVAPLTQAIQKKYENDPQKAQLEISKLYKEEGIGMMSGCLWSFVPLLLLFPLYTVIRQPLIYMLHLTADQATKIVSIIKEALPAVFSSNSYYDQLAAAPHLNEFVSQIREALPELANVSLPSLNFQFLGVDLGQNSRLAILELGNRQLGYHRPISPAGSFRRVQHSLHVGEPKAQCLCNHGPKRKPG